MGPHFDFDFDELVNFDTVVDVDESDLRTFLNMIARSNDQSDDNKKENEPMEDLPFCELMGFDNEPYVFSVPVIRSVIFNGPATTIIWADDEKTTVKLADGQEYDRYAGFCACVCKRLFGSSTNSKKMMDDHDVDVIRNRLAEKKQREKEQNKARDAAARAAKEKSEMPSYDDFRRMVTDRIIRLAADSAAMDILGQIRGNKSNDDTDALLNYLHNKEQNEDV